MRQLLLCSVASLFIGTAVVPSLAQEARPVALAIASQDLGAALTILADRAGLRLIMPSNVVAGRRSSSVSGTMTVDEALSRMLSGTGLSYRLTDGNLVTITDRVSASQAGPLPDGSMLLDTISISGGNFSAPGDEPYITAGSDAYISRDQITRLRGTSPGDIFNDTPGVIAANKNNGAKLDVNIRGMQGQGRVRVAIDGTQQASTTWRGYLGVDERVYIDPELIGGIGISKGPSGGAEGAGATGGVVSIRTLTADDILEDGASFGGRLRTGVSDNAAGPPPPLTYEQSSDSPSLFDFDNGFGSAAFAVRQENFDLVAAVARRKQGNYFAGKEGDDTHYTFDGRDYPLSFTKPGEEVFNSSQDTLSFLGKATFYLGDDHSLQLGYNRFDSEFGESMGSLLFQQDNGYRQVKLSDIRADTYSARYRWNPVSDIFDLKANLWLSDVAGTTRAVGAAPDFSEWGFIPADEPRYSEVITYGGDVTNASRIDTGFGSFEFDYGTSYLLEDMNGDEYCSRIYTNNLCVWMQPSVGERSIGSAFSDVEWEATEWLTFEGGLRYDAYWLEDKSPDAVLGKDTRDGARLNPSAAIILSPLEGFQLFGRYAEGVRPPTLRETMVSDANATPNPNLSPEVTKSWEFGFNYLRDGVISADDKLRFKLAYFHNSHENYISRVPAPPVPGEPVFTFDNLDRASFSGIELSGSYETDRFFSSAALTYYSDYEFCYPECGSSTVTYDYAIGHIPPEMSVSLTAGMKFFDERLSVGGRIIHNGERLAPIASSERTRTPYWLPYTTVDAFASYDFTENLTLDVQAQNLFDRYYVDALDGWTPAPGRTIRANLTARF